MDALGPPRRRVWPCVLLAASALACGQDRAPAPDAGRPGAGRPGAGVLSLADAATLDSFTGNPEHALDVLRPVALESHFDDPGPGLGRLLAVAELGENVPEHWKVEGERDSRFAEDSGDPALVLEPGSVYLRRLTVPRNATLDVELTWRGERGPGTLLGLVEIPFSTPLDQFDVSLLASLLTRTHPFTEAESPEDGWTVSTSVVRPLPETGMVCLVAGSFGGSLTLREVRARASKRFLDAVQEEDEFACPYVSRVTIDRDQREALLLGRDAAFRWSGALPGAAPRFTAALGVLDHSDPAGVAVELAVRSEGAELDRRWTLGPDSRGWRDVAVDLDGFDGATVELALRVTASAPGFASVAVGHPVVAPIPPEEPSEEPLDRPDIVLVSLDTVRADRLPFYGGTLPLERLERFGDGCAVFESAITPAAWTLPTHTSVFTGLLPHRHGVETPTSRLGPRAARHVVQDLRAAGYETVAFTGGGFVSPAFGMARGFERYETIDPLLFSDATGFELQRVVDTLRAPRSRPLLMFVHTFQVHNYVATSDNLARVGLTDEKADPGGQIPLSLFAKDFEAALERLGLDAAEWGARLHSVYDAALLTLDDRIGPLLDELERRPNTYVIVFSDHGEEHYDHGGFGHGHSVAEELIHVPLLIRGPEVAPRRIGDLVSLVDLGPTIREIAGLPPVGATDGHSLRGLLGGAALPARDGVLAQAQRGKAFAWRGAEYKLVRDPNRESARELFHLPRDPDERRDLAATEPRVADGLEAALERRLEALGARRLDQDTLQLSEDLTEELKRLGYL